jgi:hypothetical protein
MIGRFVDMADPSNSSVRGPSYNTEHKGRPAGKAEQSGRRIPSCTEKSTSSSRAASTLRGKGINAGRETADREREHNHYIQHLPWQFQQYMSHTVDVKADGHCGFRAIAAQIYDSEEGWAQVRHDLIEEIIQNRYLYNAVYLEENRADEILESRRCWMPTAPYTKWMDCMSLGVVIASRYNIVLHTFDANVGGCFTHLPLRSRPIPVRQRIEIAIARINSHFVQLFLRPNHPVPPIPMWWWNNASIEAKEWALSYDTRLDSWFEVLGVVPEQPQFVVNID